MRLDVFAAALCVAGPIWAQPIFEPRPISDHIYGGPWEFFVGGGLASFDCNGDGLPEILAAGGQNPAQLFLNLSAGTVAFEAHDSALGVTGVTGSYPLDIDSDGNLDVVMLRVGQNRLFLGRGDCTFEASELLPLSEDGRWTTAFSATWEVDARLPTLAFGNYVDRSNPDGPFGACDANLLYRPDDWAYPPPSLLEPGYCALSMLFTDWARQGRADLRVSNDRHYYGREGAEQLWAMEASPRLYTQADGWERHQLWGMGIASQDITGDGLPEVYLTSMGDQRLQFRDPSLESPTYTDAPFDRGVTAHRPYTGGDERPSTGWHPAFGDMDNDGWVDLFVTKGNVEEMPGAAMEDPNNLLRGQPDGTFAEVGLEAGISSMARSRGAVLADFNADGLLDIAVVNRNAPMEVFENVTESDGAWLSVDLRQTGPNPNAIGAYVDVRAGEMLWTQERTIGGGHAGGQAGPLHFGLADAATVDVTVHWPNGGVTDFPALPVNQRLILERP
ncbi:MAG: CRTAC1 family protein [Pseudomonadota bacterium]